MSIFTETKKWQIAKLQSTPSQDTCIEVFKNFEIPTPAHSNEFQKIISFVPQINGWLRVRVKPTQTTPGEFVVEIRDDDDNVVANNTFSGSGNYKYMTVDNATACRRYTVYLKEVGDAHYTYSDWQVIMSVGIADLFIKS